jgi:hypothetical protein
VNWKSRSYIGGLATASVMAGLFSLASYKHATLDAEIGWTADKFILYLLPATIVFAAIFVAGSTLLTHFKQASRAGFCVLGAVALLASWLATTGFQIFGSAVNDGSITLALAVPCLFGAVIGFIFHRKLAFHNEGDDPARLADKITATDGEGVDLTLVDTGDAQYYDGPIQVRTNLIALLATGVVAGALGFVPEMYFYAGGILHDYLDYNWVLDFGSDGLGAALNSLVEGAVFGAVLLPLPIYALHSIARWQGYTSHAAYGALGFFAPLAAGFMMFIVGLFLTIHFAIPLAVAMLVYRSLAGLEPKGLPEAVEVRDPRTLIGANHPRRRYHQVIEG